MRRFGFFALAIVATACGLSVVGEDAALTAAPDADGGVLVLPDGAVVLPDGAPVSPGSDGGVTSDGDGPVDEPKDAGKDVFTLPAGECQLVVDDQFGANTLDPRWKMVNAKFANHRVELTQGGDDLAEGVLWWTGQVHFGTTLTAVFHYVQVAASGNPGVGVGIGWVQGNPSWAIGKDGLNVGICNSNLSGVGASLRLGNELRLDSFTSVSADCATNGGVIDDFERGSGILTMKLTPDRVEATSAAKTDPVDFKVDTTGYIGFGAATGTFAAGTGMFAITEAKVEVCF